MKIFTCCCIIILCCIQATQAQKSKATEPDFFGFKLGSTRSQCVKAAKKLYKLSPWREFSSTIQYVGGFPIGVDTVYYIEMRFNSSNKLCSLVIWLNHGEDSNLYAAYKRIQSSLLAIYPNPVRDIEKYREPYADTVKFHKMSKYNAVYDSRATILTNWQFYGGKQNMLLQTITIPLPDKDGKTDRKSIVIELTIDAPGLDD